MQSQQQYGYSAVQKQDPAYAKQPGEYPMQEVPPFYASVPAQPQTAVMIVSTLFYVLIFPNSVPQQLDFDNLGDSYRPLPSE